MRKLVAVAALMLFLVPGLVAAQPKSEEVSVRESIVSLFRELARFVVGELRCSVDPNGAGCTAQPAGPTIDGGCTIDPNGGCKP
jgi:hypothetical protein